MTPSPEARAKAIAEQTRLPHGPQCRQIAEAGWLCSCVIQQHREALEAAILSALQATWEAAAAIAEESNDPRFHMNTAGFIAQQLRARARGETT